MTQNHELAFVIEVKKNGSPGLPVVTNRATINSIR
jgi:hypothetical protein